MEGARPAGTAALQPSPFAWPLDQSPELPSLPPALPRSGPPPGRAEEDSDGSEPAFIFIPSLLLLLQTDDK